MAPCWLATSREPETAKYYRTLPPAHYSLKIEAFDVLSELDKYDSGVFEAGGYRWRLSLYPKGNKEDGGSGHISLYLSIEEPPRQTVHVNYRLFVRVKSRNNYLTIQDADGAVTSFSRSKARFGFPRFLSLKEFNGYLDERGSCTFGAEVFVIQPAKMREESFTLTTYETQCTFTWRFERWSRLGTDRCCRKFSFGGRGWNLVVYPKGDAAWNGKSLSVYLEAQGLTGTTKVYAAFKLRVLNQCENTRKKNNKETQFKGWLSASNRQEGSADFMRLKDLKPTTGKEFVKHDTLVVEVQIIALSTDVGV